MSKLYVQLGRAGDILTILPILRADAQKTGEKQRLMVAKEFAGLLDGCSYIDRVVFDGDFQELGRAVNLARGMSDDVVVTSLHGSAEDVEKLAYAQIGQKHATGENFQKEAWQLARRLEEWDDCLPLVFDRRDKAREDRLLKAHGFKAKGPKKPVILLAVDGGITCPFPYAQLLRELVTLKFGDKYRVLDLPMVEKPDGRIYDLLALYEQAALLITIDSMPLHLAWATPKLPVFALANDKPSNWHGSAWRPNHLWFCRYSDWPARAVEMCEAIESMVPQETVQDIDVRSNCGGTRKDVTRRGKINIQRGMCREAEGHPFVKDAVRMAFQRVETEDSRISLFRNQSELCFSEQKGLFAPPSTFYAYRIQKGQFHPIVDLFSAPKAFWKKILPEIPDLILSDDPYWSQALMVIFQKHGAQDATGACEFVGGTK